MELKNVHRGRILEYANKHGVQYMQGKPPWNVKCDVALPCATENEINKQEAEILTQNGCFVIAEGANMPSNEEAVHHFLKTKILFGPGKAANAGGVAVSGLEMTQNSMRLAWSRKEVDEKLHSIMYNIHEMCVKYGKVTHDFTNYVKGANIAGFVKVANSMMAQGLV